MRTIYFATSNKAKAEEAKKALLPFRITIKHLNITKPEEQHASIEEIAKDGAEFLADMTKKELLVEDTGLFFDAYPGFPGPNTKQLFEQLGYDGLLRLLKGKKRTAYFKTAIGYAKPGKAARLFIGISKGSIAKKIQGKYDKNVPYDIIFIPKGYKKTYALIPEIKEITSHRVVAFQKLGKWLKKQ
ncbi:MAG: non-canonical purine NTP pyrophosphatase [Nanoarchaeota archaeon]